ncbi:aldo/keto reductase [Bacillus kwashiorkori]|uniref:aldo/keto reductase n=1 Tax=Bacillus kwashiorkori TaxID=1522318 RepID=UPI000780777F|nr:aldo/keto reductase [Bacillus kwashiorkori]
MKRVPLGNSDLYVSQLGLGCMSLSTDEKTATEIIHYALEHGINYFDTADLYDYGRNEQIVGKVLKSVRENVIIATKVGNRWTESHDSWIWDASKAYIKEAVKKSLTRLQTDYIDLYQLHGGTLEDNIDETIEAMEELIAEGYIRYYGISSIRPTVINEYARRSNIIAVMMQYSLLDRRPEEQAMPLLEKHHIDVVVRGALAKGLISDALLTKASESVKKNGYLDYSYQELTEVLAQLKEIAQSRSITSLSLQYVLANPAVASCVVGASSVKQLIENITAFSEQAFTASELQLIQSITKANIYEHHRLDI